MGQMSFVTVVLWWWALVSWKHERWGQLGVAVALAAFKPQMAVLLVIALVAQKRWKSVAYLVGAEFVLWAVALLLGGHPGAYRLSGYAQGVGLYGWKHLASIRPPWKTCVVF